MSWSRSRWGVLTVLAGLALAFAAVPAATADPVPAGTLSLHVADNAGAFTYTPVSGPVETQSLPTPDKCQVTVSGSLVDMTGSDRGVGLVGTSIGIKSGGATGTPCGRVDTTEDMTLTLDGVPNAVTVALDLELKGNAKVRLVLKLGTTTVGTFEVRSGSSIVAGEGRDGTMSAPFTALADSTEPVANCRNASDSGPDSGGNDNCRLTIDPDGFFDTIVFQPLVGEFSLEGGGDEGTSDTVFTLATSPPAATNDSYSVDEDETLTVTAPGVLGNDVDADGDTLTAALVSGPTSGTLILGGDGSFTYTPNANFHGSDSFTYSATAADGTSNATVSITVNSVNDQPTATNQSYVVVSPGPLTVAAPGLLDGATDADVGDTLSAVVVTGPSNGTLTVNADGSFVYTPAPAVFGTDSLTFQVCDDSGAANACSAGTTTVTIEVFEGTLGCDPENNTASDADGAVAATITRYVNLDGSECVLKPYTLTADEADASVTFDVSDPVVPAQPAAYEAFLTFDQELTNPLTATLTYDDSFPYTSFVNMPACVADPFVTDGDDTPGSINDEAIPSGHTACIVDVTQNWDGTTTWHVAFTADIRFKG